MSEIVKDDIRLDLRVVILHRDDSPIAGGSVVLDGGDVEWLDGEGVHHTDVDSLIVNTMIVTVRHNLI